MKAALVIGAIVGIFLIWTCLKFLWFIVTQLIRKSKNGKKNIK